MNLFDPVQFLKGVGPRRSETLAAAGIRTIYDLVTYYPRKHYDRGQIRPIRQARSGESTTVMGVVASMGVRRTSRKFMTLFELVLEDESGSIGVVFFKQPYLENTFRVGDTVVVTGPVKFFNGLQITPTEWEILNGEDDDPIHAVGLVPSYTVPASFGPKQFRSLLYGAVHEHGALLPEPLPAEIRARRRLIGIAETIEAIHFPENIAEYDRARRRLAYEEFFVLQTYLAQRRREAQEEAVGVPLRMSDALDFRIRSLIPFELTKAQQRVIGEIRRDLALAHPMNRLLQGDVGSGKTIVAAYALLAAIGNRAQAALMAPTEILAEQHYRTFSRLLDGKKVRIALLARGRKKKERDEARAAIAAGEIDLVIGTHAIVEEAVEFRKLALVVIDEQQKFGVLQRGALRLKGRRPHTLVMTATPIPRTLSMTLYGDLDVSVINEMPPGRRPVLTLRKREPEAVAFVRQKVREGRQAFFVYPLVNDSDKVAAQSATAMHEKLRGEFREHRVELLHGRMKPEEKDAIMAAFRSGAIHVLVSTIVVEVGIDVPNASVMAIGNAERYGLSQLHQLRGRIGRGTHESYCLVLAGRSTPEAEERLRAFVSTTDGFKIAEADLKIRGPGELFGTRQSGLPEFRAANPVSDLELLAWAREDAFGLQDAPPALDELVRMKYKSRETLVQIS